MNHLALVRLLQLGSQALPIGGYSHSQGLESAIEERLVHDEQSLLAWISDVCEHCMIRFEIPCLLAMARAWAAHDVNSATEWNCDYLASRESAEFRAATVQMGFSLRALLSILPGMPADIMDALRQMHEPSLPCMWSAAATAWKIEPAAAAVGYLWNWAENQVLVAVKSIPLGQSAGQRVLVDFGARIAQLCDELAAAGDAAYEPHSNFAPGLAILSSRHESQYSRLFRS